MTILSPRAASTALLLLLVSPSGGAWLPRSASFVSTPYRIALMKKSNDDEAAIAKAWKSVDDTMNRNDMAALDILQELSESLKQLELTIEHHNKHTNPFATLTPSMVATLSKGATLSQRELELANAAALALDEFDSSDKSLEKLQQLSDEFQQTLGEVAPIQEDPEVAQLIAQLANQDAQEFLEKESRIAHAKELSEGVTMEAKLDQQEKHVAPPPAKEKDPIILQAHDVCDEEASKLVAQLAAMEAKEFQERESRIARAKELSEGVTMQAKWDIQEATPAVPRTSNRPPVGFVQDEEAASLVAELAAMEAADVAWKESLINSAREGSIIATMQAKLEMQQQEFPEAPKPATQPAFPLDAEAKDLVAQLATLEAEALNWRESLIDTARDNSIMATMEAKLNMQEGIDFVPAAPQDVSAHQAPFVQPVVGAKEPVVVDDEAAHLVAQLAARDAAELAAKESLVNATRDASEVMTMQAKIEMQQEQEMVTDDPPVVAMPEEEGAYEAAHLVAQLASLEAEEVAAKESLVNAARDASEAMTMQAKLEMQQQQQEEQTAMNPAMESLKEEEEESSFEAVHLVAQLASLEAEELAAKESLINTARDVSEGVTMQAKLDMQQQKEEEEGVATKSIVTEPTVEKPVEEESAQIMATQQEAQEAYELAMQESLHNLAEKKQQKQQQPIVMEEPQISKAGPVVMDAVVEKFDKDVEEEPLVSFSAVEDTLNVDAKFEMQPITSKEVKEETMVTEMALEDTETQETLQEAAQEVLEVDELLAEESEVQESLQVAAQEILDKANEKAGMNAQQLAAQEIPDGSDLMADLMEEEMTPTSNNNDYITTQQAIIDAAQREVLPEVQFQTKRLVDQAVMEQLVHESTNLMDYERANLADATNNGFSPKKAAEIQASQKTTPSHQLIEPLPQDVTNHQEDRARFFFASRAAQEISMREDPYIAKRIQQQKRQELLLQARKELSASELAAKEHDEVDQQLKDLFADVSLGFKEVKTSLAKLLQRSGGNSTMTEMDDSATGSSSNSTSSWDGVTP